MPTSYTNLLGLAVPVTGELNNTWGDVFNDEIVSLLEEAVAGAVTIDTWTTNSHTLTVGQGVSGESRNAILLLTDTGTALTGAGEVICPSSTKLYAVSNNTGQDITIKTSIGTGVVIKNGYAQVVACDSQDVITMSQVQTAVDVDFSPSGNLVATTVQAALEELDTEKASTAQGGLADSALQAGDNVSTLVNDANYVALADNISGLTNDAGYLATVADDSHNHTGASISGLDAGDTTTGTFADARISETSVTQHQAAIDAGSVDGYDIVVDTGTPSGTDANTIYFVI